MNRPLDRLLLSAPFVTVLAAICFLVVWKPRLSSRAEAARWERVFWSATLTVGVVVVVYVGFFR